jgi:hypothetical protein
VFPGLYAGADGGEVIFTVPERTACFLCAKAARYALEESDPDPSHDYGTGRLIAQVALAADIHHLTTAAAKLALGLLAQADSPTSAFVEDAISADITYLTMSMTPQFWFYPAVFGSVPSQYAYQSVWLAPSRQEDCPVCGSTEYRRPWQQREPSLAELQDAAKSTFGTGTDSETQSNHNGLKITRFQRQIDRVRDWRRRNRSTQK